MLARIDLIAIARQFRAIALLIAFTTLPIAWSIRSQAQETTAQQWDQVAANVYRSRTAAKSFLLVSDRRGLLIGAAQGLDPHAFPSDVERIELVLLTHHHRDSSSAAERFVVSKIPVRAPELSAAYLLPEGVAAYWKKSMPVDEPGRFLTLFERFWSDWTYLVHPTGIAGIDCSLKPGEKLRWHDWSLTVIGTPGHSKDHCSYLATRGDQRLIFAGDAVHSAGRVWSPYSMEWHHQKDEGFVAASVSLRTLAAHQPTHLFPEHGEPLIGEDIAPALLSTAESLSQLGVLKNFDAYSKQFGPQPSYKFLAPEQVGTANPMGNSVPWSKLSPHLLLSGNTYALLSQDGPVLLMDPYSANIVDRVAELKRDHRAGPVEVACISHAHNDHYTGIFALPERSTFQVWTLDRIAAVVDDPFRWLAPYVDPRLPRVDRRLKDNEVIRWHEYELRTHHLPGQTDFGMGLEVTVDDRKCLFTGDNFYHVEQYSGGGGWSGRNRGLPLGYARTAEKILKLKPDWILAEHGGAFEFNVEDFQRRRDFALRAAEVADRLSPSGRHQADWDPQQVRIEPLISRASIGHEVALKIVATNFQSRAVTIEATSHRPDLCEAAVIKFPADTNRESSAELRLTLRANTPRGRHIIPFSVTADGHPLPSDTFAVLIVE